MEELLTGLGWTLNADKTRIVDAAEGFDFLGMPLRRKPLRSNPKRLFCSRWPSTRARHSIREKIREAIGYDDLYSLEEKRRAINPLLRGWGQYFSPSNAHRHLKKIDSYVYTKLVNFLRRKHKRRGKGCRAFPPQDDDIDTQLRRLLLDGLPPNPITAYSIQSLYADQVHNHTGSF